VACNSDKEMMVFITKIHRLPIDFFLFFATLILSHYWDRGDFLGRQFPNQHTSRYRRK
jgi:hypothetical protein